MALGKIQTKIVDALVDEGRITPEQRVTIATNPEDLTGDQLDKFLQTEMGVTEFQLLMAKGRAFKLAPFNVARYTVHSGTFERLDHDFCETNNILPVGDLGDLMVVAVSNPFDVSLAIKVQELSGKRIIRVLGRAQEIKEKFAKVEAASADFTDVVSAIGIEYSASADVSEEDLTDEQSGPIIDLANRIIEDAYLAGTSDIHVEPWEHEMIIRYRVDGICQEKLRLPGKVGPALVARLKIMCNLDIAERRLPQDGRIVFKQYTKKSIDVDLRVSTAPLNYGEGVVMRILDKQKSTLPMHALGFSADNMARYRHSIEQPYGMILHCGPTGSGKSMTLYSALNEINSPDLVIRTAEDPIEYTLAGINQMQMHRQIGLTFASALRAFLRQDPDIILVGEIRDKETANIAVEAALTGHLLISTLHTNDAPSTVARLTDMGVEPFMISSSLLCVCAQRLMRRVCKQCRQPEEASGRAKELLEKGIGWSGTIYKANPKGCAKCNNLGYKGRVGIHELMTNNEELTEAINRESDTAALKRICQENGMKTLHQDSLLKVKDGITTLEEALSNVPPDM